MNGRRLVGVGLLILRIVFGAGIALAGFMKLQAGPDMIEQVGKMAQLPGDPMTWGLIATYVELLGGLALILGFMVKPTALFLAFVMSLAIKAHIGMFEIPEGSDLEVFVAFYQSIQTPLLYASAFLSLVFSGPGYYSADKYLFYKNCGCTKSCELVIEETDEDGGDEGEVATPVRRVQIKRKTSTKFRRGKASLKKSKKR